LVVKADDALDFLWYRVDVSQSSVPDNPRGARQRTRKIWLLKPDQPKPTEFAPADPPTRHDKFFRLTGAGGEGGSRKLRRGFQKSQRIML
jgi:hypothetical protein